MDLLCSKNSDGLGGIIICEDGINEGATVVAIEFGVGTISCFGTKFWDEIEFGE